MAYTELVTKGTTDTFATTDWNAMADDFNASIPAIFEAKGDLAVGTGSQAIARLAVGSNYQTLQSSTDAENGIEWSDYIGVGLSTDTVTITNGTTETEVTFFTEDWDTNGFHVSSPTTDAQYITLPITGMYLITVGMIFADNATGDRAAYVNLYSGGGVTQYGNTVDAAPDAETGLYFSILIYASAGDYLYLTVYQTSGDVLDVTYIEFTATYLR